MKKFLIAICMMFSIAAYAGTDTNSVRDAGFYNLSEVEKAEVLKLVAEKSAAKGSSQPSTEDTVEKLSKWADISAGIGRGLASTAKELGVAVNSFVETPVGKMTAVLIIWKIVG